MSLISVVCSVHVFPEIYVLSSILNISHKYDAINKIVQLQRELRGAVLVAMTVVYEYKTTGHNIDL